MVTWNLKNIDKYIKHPNTLALLSVVIYFDWSIKRTVCKGVV